MNTRVSDCPVACGCSCFCSVFGRLRLLPASAEGCVELYERSGLLLLRLDEEQLGIVEGGVRGEDFEVAGVSACITQPGETNGIRGRGDLSELLFAVLPG